MALADWAELSDFDSKKVAKIGLLCLLFMSLLAAKTFGQPQSAAQAQTSGRARKSD